MSTSSSNEDAAAAEARRGREELIRLLFGLPAGERIYEDYGCALSKGFIPFHGRLYISERAVYFYSNVFGKERREVVALRSVTALRKKKTLGMIPNALQIVRHRAGAPVGGGARASDTVTFTSFFGSQREACYNECTPS